MALAIALLYGPRSALFLRSEAARGSNGKNAFELVRQRYTPTPKR